MWQQDESAGQNNDKYFLLTAEILISYVSTADAVIQMLENYLSSVNNVKFNESLMLMSKINNYSELSVLENMSPNRPAHSREYYYGVPLG